MSFTVYGSLSARWVYNASIDDCVTIPLLSMTVSLSEEYVIPPTVRSGHCLSFAVCGTFSLKGLCTIFKTEFNSLYVLNLGQVTVCPKFRSAHSVS